MASSTMALLGKSSHIGDLVIGEDEDTNNNNDDAPSTAQTSNDAPIPEGYVEQKIATLEAEITSRQAEIARLKSIATTPSSSSSSALNTKITQDNLKASTNIIEDEHSTSQTSNNTTISETDLSKVQNEVQTVKDNARLLLRHMAKQTSENEALQLELSTLKEELKVSLTEASTEIITSNNALELKTTQYNELLNKYNELSTQFNTVDDNESNISKAIQNELELVTNSSKEMKLVYQNQISTLEQELATVEASLVDREDTIDKQLHQIDDLKNGIKSMAKELNLMEQQGKIDAAFSSTATAGGTAAGGTNRGSMEETNGKNICTATNLNELANLWEVRLDENKRKRKAVAAGASTADVESKSSPTSASHTEEGDDLESKNGTSATIDNDNSGSAPSKDTTSSFPSTQSTNRWFFGSSKKKQDSTSINDMKQQRDNDTTINELEDVILANIDIIRYIKCAIEEIDRGEENEKDEGEGEVSGDTTSSTTDNLVRLKEALANLNNTKRFDDSEEEASPGQIATLQMSVKALESSQELQELQNNTLKAELSRLQSIINNVDNQSSSQEDEIETLKAQVIKLQLTNQLLEDEKHTLEEAQHVQLSSRDMAISNIESNHVQQMNILENKSGGQEDMIEQLQAELCKLQVQSNIQVEEQRHVVEEMKTKIELKNLEEESTSPSSTSFPDLL